MHDCPHCGSACHCDGEDHYQPAPNDCTHACDDDDIDPDGDPDDDDPDED